MKRALLACVWMSWLHGGVSASSALCDFADHEDVARTETAEPRSDPNFCS